MWLLALLVLAQGDRMIEPDAPVSGALTESSAPGPGGRRGEFYGLRCVTGLAIQVDAVSDWDNFALIVAPDGRTVAQNDDGGDANNARIAWTCPDNQLYRIGVASYHAGVTGVFTLRVTVTGGATSPVAAPDRSGGGGALLPLDAQVHGTLSASSARYLGYPIHYYRFRCREGLVVRIDLTSAFDNLLFVFGPGGEVMRNDDANGTNAGVLFSCPDAQFYRIGAAAQRESDTGPFRLGLRNLSPPAGPTPAAPPRRSGIGTIFPGATVDGVLRADAPPFEGRPAAFYALQCQAGLPLRIDVVSSWDNVAWVVGQTGRAVAFADNAEGTTNARIAWRCPNGQVYRVGVGAFNAATGGPFTLSVQPTGTAPVPAAPSAAGGPPLAGTLYPGARIDGNLLAGAPRYEERPTDFYALRCAAGLMLRLELRSRFDNVLVVTDSAGRKVAFNDDARSTDAALTWRCPDGGLYRVGASARNAGPAGAYRLIAR